MYNEFFGLHKAPFSLTPDPEFLYLTTKHREAVAGLTYAIMARKGFVVLTGDAGTGKTTLLTRVLTHLPDDRIEFSVIVNPTLTPPEFLEAALMDFGLKDIPDSKAQRIAMLQGFLKKRYEQGKIAALIVDEAHKLTPELIEEVRLLGNFESTSEKLLQVVLMGQSELDEMLNQESLRQFKQRISLRLTIEPLAANEIGHYIRYRWTKAGGTAPPFTADAIATIGLAAQGIPRIVNVICDNALLMAFGEQASAVEQRHVMSVCRELQFAEPSRKAAPGTQVAAAPVAEMPVVETVPMRTLERYETAAKKKSLLGRLVARFKSTQRTESA
jgi:type II secretory pathway predicted ATPase ExeA